MKYSYLLLCFFISLLNAMEQTVPAYIKCEPKDLSERSFVMKVHGKVVAELGCELTQEHVSNGEKMLFELYRPHTKRAALFTRINLASYEDHGERFERFLIEYCKQWAWNRGNLYIVAPVQVSGVEEQGLEDAKKYYEAILRASGFKQRASVENFDIFHYLHSNAPMPTEEDDLNEIIKAAREYKAIRDKRGN